MQLFCKLTTDFSIFATVPDKTKNNEKGGGGWMG